MYLELLPFISSMTLMINSDIATLKLNWAKTKRNNVSQFEKDSIKKDLNIISEFIKKVINRFKR